MASSIKVIVNLQDFKLFIKVQLDSVFFKSLGFVPIRI